MQIIVLGSYRSGSSLVTRIINMMGAYFDAGVNEIGFTSKKNKGFWERQDVVECNDALLKLSGCTDVDLFNWKILNKKPSKKQMSEASDEIEKMQLVIDELNENKTWVVKDPRMCLTLPYWRGLLDKPVAIMVSRNPAEGFYSMSKRENNSLAEASAIWEYYNISMLNVTDGMNIIHVNHRDLIKKPVDTVKKLFADLHKFGEDGLEVPTNSKLKEFINEELYRTKTDEITENKITTAFQQSIYNSTVGSNKPKADKSKTDKFELSDLAKNTMKQQKYVGEIKLKLVKNNNKIASLDQTLAEMTTDLEQTREQISSLITNQDNIAESPSPAVEVKQSFGWKLANLFGKSSKA